MKRTATALLGAIMLISGCKMQDITPDVVDMPYCDANTTLPGIELTQIQRTDSSTEVTFMALYDYHDTTFPLGDEINLVNGYFKAPVQEIVSIGNTVIQNNRVIMHQGVPSQFKLIFPPLPDDFTSIDFVQTKNGKVKNSIWGIDLTGKRSPDELPADIPSDLLLVDMAADSLPSIVEKDGVAKVTIHAVAWRDWMNRNVSMVINTIDDTQQTIHTEFDKEGVATLEIPLKGTAQISAYTPYNTYADVYVDPDEHINLYVLPDNRSDAQRFIRPNGVIDGKYRNIKAMSRKLLFFEENADTLLLDKTDTDEYFAAMMQIHAHALNSIRTGNFAPALERYARSGADRQLMRFALNPDANTTRDWDARDAAKPDTVLRFTPDQIRQIRSAIDFSNPLLELKSIGNPGYRSNFLKAKALILAD